MHFHLNSHMWLAVTILDMPCSSLGHWAMMSFVTATKGSLAYLLGSLLRLGGGWKGSGLVITAQSSPIVTPQAEHQAPSCLK